MENWIVFDNCFIIVIQNNRDLKQTNEKNKRLIFKGKSTQHDLKCKSRYVKETLMYNSNSERTAKL